MKITKTHTILFILGVVFIVGYIAFIWGRLPGQFDPSALDGKGKPSPTDFSCGWNFRSPMLSACNAWKFLHDSIQAYVTLTIVLPLTIVFGLFLAPVYLLEEPSMRLVSIVWLAIYGVIAYVFYRWYIRKKQS